MSKNKSNKKGGTTRPLKPTESKFAGVTTPKTVSASEPMLYNKSNYMLILGGLALIIIGYVLMSGGNMTDPNVFDEDVIYSTRRTLIAPIFILAGLGVEIYAVFKK